MLARCAPALAALALVFQPGTAFAESDAASIDLAKERRAIELYQQVDQKLQNIGWELIQGNAEFCSDAIPSVGLQLQDLATYGDPDLGRAALDLQGDFAVQTAALGSPAQMHGGVTANREIIGLSGTDPNTWEMEPKRRWSRLTRAHDFIDEELRNGSALELAFGDGGMATLRPVLACKARFELLSDSKKAISAYDRVQIGMKGPIWQYSDAVIAGLVAHELAHTLLNHSAWHKEHGRKRRHVRLTEREADRLAPWLLANTQYGADAAYEFMTTWGPKHSRGWLTRARTHDGWDERAEFIKAEIAQVEQAMASHGKADWSTHFRREIDPDGPIPK